jgi:hypothetical protein
MRTSTLERITLGLVVAATLAVAALPGCGGGDAPGKAMSGDAAGPPAPRPDGGAPAPDGGGAVAKVRLIDWVDDLVTNYTTGERPPDTVDDKVDIIIDTEDPGAFDPLLAR